MLKLRRLRVEKFRGLVHQAELVFSDSVNVLLGQNGTGKTTLLELISMVVRSYFSSLAKEEFAIEYELVAPGGPSIVVVMRNLRSSAEVVAALPELGSREVYRAGAEIREEGSQRVLARYDADQGLTAEKTPAIPLADTLSPIEQGFLVLIAAIVPSLGRFSLSLQQVGNARRLDESLDLFRSLVGGGSALRGELWVATKRWRTNPLAPAFVPASVMQLMSARDSTRPEHSFTHAELDWLEAIRTTMGFGAADIRIDVTRRTAETPANFEVAELGDLVFRFWWADGSFITHERLSYGQKRLVAFFYYLACNPDIVVADELVNGLHHRWIAASIAALGQRQAFLTSQNPLLLDYLPITSAEDVKRSFVLCRGESRDGRPGWTWNNMSDEDAEELFSAYGVGIEHVSEILQSRGLW